MRISYPTSPRTGIVISFIIALLINSYQLCVIVFNLAPPHKGPADIIRELPSPWVDITVNFIYCVVISWLLYELNMYIIYKMKRKYNIFWRILLSFLLVTVLTYTFAQTYIHLYSITGGVKWGVAMHLRGRGIMIMFIVIALAQILYLNKRNQEQQLEMERLISENIRSQYIALKNQIDPHFLFNSLNTLSGLIMIDAVGAKEYTQRLSSIFRYAMQNKEIVSVAQELEFAKNYAELMQIRYKDALSFEYKIDPIVMNDRLLPFSLQTLIENAVKHNTITSQKPLVIKIFSDMENRYIVVENEMIAKREKESGEGIGLKNLSLRYELLGHKPLKIKCIDNRFSVAIPII